MGTSKDQENGSDSGAVLESDDSVEDLVNSQEYDVNNPDGTIEKDGSNEKNDDLMSKTYPSRGEKKARKIMSKLDLRQVPGIVRATIKKSKNILFVINNPDVYKVPASETYIMFGAAKMEDLSQNAQMEAASKFTAKADPPMPKENMDDLRCEKTPEDDVDEDVDDDGLDAQDVELVMTQANVTKARAVKALKNNTNDVVNAIMDLTI